MSLDTSSLGQYEVISTAVSAIPTCTLATAATTSTPAAAPSRMMAPRKPPPQQRPSSPDFSVEESPSRSGPVQKEEGKEVVDPPPVPTAPTARDRSRSPRRHASQPESDRRFRIDQPVDYLYLLTLHVQLVSGLGSVTQQQQFQAMDNFLRSQLANDSGPLGTAATQPLPVLLYTLSPVFAVWQLSGRQ